MDIGFKLDTSEVRKELDALEKDLTRATMYGIRAAGRAGKQVAKRHAPVYKGKDKRAEPGLLKASIHSSKQLKRPAKGVYRLQVGPWGGRVNWYRSKANARYEFMQSAFQEVEGKMASKFNNAYTNVLKKRGRI